MWDWEWGEQEDGYDGVWVKNSRFASVMEAVVVQNLVELPKNSERTIERRGFDNMHDQRYRLDAFKLHFDF